MGAQGSGRGRAWVAGETQGMFWRVSVRDHVCRVGLETHWGAVWVCVVCR